MNCYRPWLLALGLAIPAGCAANTPAEGAAGTPVGVVDVGGRRCEGFDRNGDGRPDGVDCDGDGILDGEDLDGDGVITIWSDLDTGALPPTAQDIAEAVPAIDPDLLDNLDKAHPPSRLTGSGTIDVPSSIDIKISDGVLQPLQQGQQASCAAFAVGAVAALSYAKQSGKGPDESWPSMQFLYHRQLAASYPKFQCTGGSYLHEGLNQLVFEGAPSAEELPYSGEPGAVCKIEPKVTAGHRFRIGGWELLRRFDRVHVKKALAGGLAVPFGVKLPNGFMSFHGEVARGVFKGEGSCVESTHCGGHAMVIVGYDDAKSAYHVLNSWGTDWGDRGYVWWDYENLEKQEELHGYQIIPHPEPGEFAPPNAEGLTVDAVGDGVAFEIQGKSVLAVRIKASEPIRLTKAVLNTPSGPVETPIKPWIAYGDLWLWTGAQPMPAGPAKATISLALRDGKTLTRELSFTVR